MTDTTSLRRAVGELLIEGVCMLALAAGGAAGAWLVHRVAAPNWSDTTVILASGVGAVLAASAAYDAVDKAMAPLRRSLRANTTAPQSSSTAPGTDVLAEITAATEADAARQAALDTCHLAAGTDHLLGDAARWRGYENGEATFHLTPGLVLHYRTTKTRYGHREEYTLLSSNPDDEPVHVTSLAQVRHHLAARAAGLPVSQPTDEQVLDAA